MKLWSLKEDNDIPVAKVGGKNVCDTDIRSLRPGQWLTDTVKIEKIHFSINLVSQKQFYISILFI